MLRIGPANTARSMVFLASVLVAVATNAIEAASEVTSDRAANPASPPEISRGNVASLQHAFSFRTGLGVGSGPPQVAGGRLLVLSRFPHTLMALEVADEGPRIAWTYRPASDASAAGKACCAGDIPGPVAQAGRLVLNTVDGRTVVLDAETGHVVWEAKTIDGRSGETLASSPLVTPQAIVVGNAGDDFGVRGRITALDPATGRTIWTRTSTGPDSEVGIGSAFSPHYAGERGRELGVRTWPPGGWERGGGAVSGPLLYDPEAALIFHGTGRAAPLNPDQRPGENKWTSGLFARDAASGNVRWFYQLAPHDLWGYGGTGPLLLADRDWQGRPRKLLIHVGLNGYVYVLDRVTGAVLSAEPFVPVNASRGIDLATGALIANDEKATRVAAMARDVCPAWTGAVAPDGATLSQETGIVYIAASHLCMDIEARPANFIAGTPFVGANVRAKPAPGAGLGALVAWSIDGAGPLWSVRERFPLVGAPLSLPGGLVLYGTLDGVLKAVDARDGSLVWQHKLSALAVSGPILFRRPDGKPYVTVLAGGAGMLGVGLGSEVDSRDSTAGRGLANVLRGLPQAEESGGTLHLFALP